MKKPIKIAFVVDSLGVGGAEILALRLSKGLIRKGFSVHFIGIGSAGNLVPMLQEAEIAYDALNCPEGVSFSAIKQLISILRKNGSDIILSNHFRQLVHAFLPSIFLGLPVFQIEHDNLHYRTVIRYKWILSLLMLRVKKIIIISPTLNNWFSENLLYGKSKIALIPNGIDTDIFRPSIQRKMTFLQKFFNSTEYTVFGTCARLEPVKNIELMIDVFYLYHLKNPKTCLLIIGDGSCMNSLQKKVENLDIEPYVLFIGLQADVVKWYQIMDYYLLTSDDEGLPLSVLEAMSCGVPIVSRDVGDLPRLIRHDFGRIVEGTIHKEWVNCLESLPKSKNEYNILSYNAIEQIKRKYSFDICLRKYIDLFRRC